MVRFKRRDCQKHYASFADLITGRIFHRACSAIGFTFAALTSIGALGVFGNRGATETAEP